MLQILLGSSLGPARTADPALARLVTQGRGSLAFLIGDSECRQRLLGACINWDRVLLAFEQDHAVGYVAFKHDARGPFALRSKPFVREFGRVMGWLRFAGFCLSECREWRYPFLLYGLRVDKSARNQGVGSGLVQACCAHARMSGFREVFLEVPLDNDRARQLYLHNGFRLLRKRWVPFPPVRTMHRPMEAAL
ncbi:MAG TPA: GNAT family N-acetyltransferase [Pseudomonas sp.]|uniref:GNAT family N-acetyltransferase n=1 Tax=Pseudomonas sp. TaxID=306 RepID=UPI002B48066C|nr:GNAT family N-acetyltransferase [Pseudomonas sp.]HKS14101.1 GNAT family N-acetyltransferase [Pseudomonas sp.]